MRHVLFALTLTATPALAQMSAAEFDAYTQGKTLIYGANGGAYGAESYLPDRRVKWSFLDGECKEGYWYQDTRGLICFIYEGETDNPQCWSFERGTGGLIAMFEDDPSQTMLYEARDSSEDMVCLGPKVGV